MRGNGYLFLGQVVNCTPNEADTDSRCQTILPEVKADDTSVRTISQIAFGAIAIVCVIFVMISGFKLTISQGDPQAIAKARQSLIYSLTGFIIALMAEIIVTFVLGRL